MHNDKFENVNLQNSQTPVVRWLDNASAIHGINLYPVVDSAVRFAITYPALDSDLFFG